MMPLYLSASLALFVLTLYVVVKLTIKLFAWDDGRRRRKWAQRRKAARPGYLPPYDQGWKP